MLFGFPISSTTKRELWELTIWSVLVQELRLAKWLEQVNATLVNTEEVSFDTLQDLLETGNSLPQKKGLWVHLTKKGIITETFLIARALLAAGRFLGCERIKRLKSRVSWVVSSGTSPVVKMDEATTGVVKLRSSELWTPFCNCVEKPEKFRISTGFEPMTSRYGCDALTNWAMKPLTLGAGHLWVLIFPWGMNQWTKWYMKWIIYWTADIKSSKAMILTVMDAIFAIA